ncbi:hypothetical protein Hanom_Chr02g00127071 [Helianthus anomalus]
MQFKQVTSNYRTRGLKYELSHYPQLKRNFVSKFGTYLLRMLGKLYRLLVFLGCHMPTPFSPANTNGRV